MKEQTRPLPENPSYKISESGRLYSANGQCRPEQMKNCRSRSARYSFFVNGKKQRSTIKDLMLAVWGLDFVPTPQWITTVCEEWEAGKESREKNIAMRKREKSKKKILPPIPCGICRELFTPDIGNQHTCKNIECQKERQRRATRNTRKKKKEAASAGTPPLVIASNFPCPFTDHYDEKSHFIKHAGTTIHDFPDYSFAQNDPFGRYGDYEHHAVRKNEPQQEKIAA